MIPSLEIAYVGMKASLDQLELIGEQMAQLASGNEPARDIVKLLEGQRTFEANTAMVHTADELVGLIIDLTV